jgi:enolase
LARIGKIQARQVLDSRGNPTVEVEVLLSDGAHGRAIVPSGASTGKAEALELRDGNQRQYLGRGVQQAVDNVKQEIAPALQGLEARDQSFIDTRLRTLDGTPNKRRLGANAVLGASLAVARASAASARLPLYRYLGGAAANELPVPMVNILSGGAHGGGNVDFQDFLVIPLRAQTYTEALLDVVAVFRAMKEVLTARGVYRAGVADEGGYAPELGSNETGFELMVEALERAGLRPGEDATLAVDVASSQFYARGVYNLSCEKTVLNSSQLVDRLEAYAGRYPLLSIEDGLAEEDWAGWRSLTSRLVGRCQLLGDDLIATNPGRLTKAIRERVANAVLVKMNQVGTLTETLEVIDLAKRSGYRTVVSARSGETEDDSLADLAVATGASQIKVGAITRSERLAKYNRLVRIEEELGRRATYRGSEVFENLLSKQAGARTKDQALGEG